MAASIYPIAEDEDGKDEPPPDRVIFLLVEGEGSVKIFIYLKT
jgi:hypothetical protein